MMAVPHFLEFLSLVANVMMAVPHFLESTIFAVLVLGGQCNDGLLYNFCSFWFLIYVANVMMTYSTILLVLVLNLCGQCNDGCSTFLGVHISWSSCS